jgi:glycosyltransferase involved in cell wall biosynthesis
MTMTEPNYAIISDQLAGGIGGAENLLWLAMDLLPQADVYTTVIRPEIIPSPYNKRVITPTWIQKLPNAGKLYKAYLPLMPLAVEMLDLQAYDVVLSMNHSMAKGVVVRPDATHVCYCHSPARYIWDMFWTYSEMNQFSPFKHFVVAALSSYLRMWDVTSAQRVDHFLANSSITKQRIETYYNRPAEILHPGCDTKKFQNLGTDDYYLMVGRLVAYKGFDLAVEVFNQLKLPLKIAGSGPELEALRAKAGPTVEILGRVDDATLKTLVGRCKGFIFPGKEDFGIVMVEAQAAGKPVIALSAGGAIDIVKHGETGWLTPEYTVEAFKTAVLEANQQTWHIETIAQHAEKFSIENFQTRLKEILDNPAAVKSRKYLTL